MPQQDAERRREQREAAVLNIGCILLRIHKRVLLDNPSQILKRKRERTSKTPHIFIYIHIKTTSTLTLSNKVMYLSCSPEN